MRRVPIASFQYSLQHELASSMSLEGQLSWTALQPELESHLKKILARSQQSFAAVFAISPALRSPALSINLGMPKDWLVQFNRQQGKLFSLVSRCLKDGETLNDRIGNYAFSLQPFHLGGQISGAILVSGTISEGEMQQTLKVLAPAVRNPAESAENWLMPKASQELSTLELFGSVQDYHLSLADVEEKIAAGIRRIFYAGTVTTYLMDEKMPGILYEKTISKSDERFRPNLARIDDGSIWKCIQTNRPVFTALTPGGEEAGGADYLPSALCLPLAVGGKVFGTVEIGCVSRPRFSANEIKMLQSIAACLANAIQSRRAFDEAQAAAQKLQTSSFEILNSRNTLRAVFDNIPSSIYIIDKEYTVVAVNMSRADRTGLKPQQIFGSTCYRLFHGQTSPCAGCRAAETFNNGSHTLRKDQDPAGNDWEINTYPIPTTDPDLPARVIVVEQNITEKLRLEANLVRSEKLATIGQLVAGVAHEINNPLTAIIANAQMLERSLGTSDPENYEMINLINTAGDRVSRVVSNLLDISRSYQKPSEPLNLNHIIQSVSGLLQHKFHAKNARLLLDLDPNMPRITVHKDDIEGLLINLMINAVDAIENDQPVVQIKTQRDGSNCVIDVKDNGAGISAQHLEHIFEPFFTTKEQGKGTGLGLSICYRIVKSYQGTIEVTSEPGNGALFHVVLPVLPAA